MIRLVSESGPKTLHPSFKHMSFDMLKMICKHVLWLLKKWVKTACKTGHFFSAEHFDVLWRIHLVSSGQFFQQNFQDVILT
jgi:hypothetical protein